MTDPITAGLIAGLAAQKFAEGAAGKAAEKLIERLWDAIATRFKGKAKVEGELAKIEAAKGQAPEAVKNLTTVLEGEMFGDDEFAATVQQLAQQIINIQNQTQSQSTITFTSRDESQMRAVGQVYGTANLGDQK